MLKHIRTDYRWIVLLIVVLLCTPLDALAIQSPESSAFTATLDTDGNLVLSDNGSGTDDHFMLCVEGDKLTVNVTGATLQQATTSEHIALNNIPGDKIIINGGDGDDTLTLDFGDGSTPFTHEIVFNGQGQNRLAPFGDTLVLKGTGYYETITFGYINASDGTIDISGNARITYTGLEPISMSIDATNVTLNYSLSAESITITDAANGQTTIDSTAGEVVTFNNPTGQLTINPGDTGVNTINLNSLSSNYPANIEINGGSGGDTVNISAAMLLGILESLTVSAQHINLEPGASIATTGGAVNLNADATLQMQNGSSISSVTGDITLVSDGIDIDSSTIQSAGALTLAPSTSGTTIGLGGAPGTLNLDDTELGMLADGFSQITIGSATAGDIAVDSATFNDPVKLVTGGKITNGGASGTDIASWGNAVTLVGTLAPGASPGTFSVAGNVALADNNTFELDITGATATASYDVLDIAGSLNIGTNVSLSILPDAYTHETGELNIISVSGTTPVTGMFAGLPEGAQTNPGGTPNFIISYVGGDGNDVTLTAANPATVNVRDMIGGHNWMLAVFGVVVAMIPLVVKRRR